MKKNTLLVIIAVVGICLLVIAYVLHLMDYIPGLKTVLDRGLFNEKYMLWIGSTEIIMMALSGIFGLLCLKVNSLRHVRNVFLILLLLFMLASSSVLFFFSEDKVPHGENALLSESMYYLMIRYAAIGGLVAIILYVIAVFAKDKIFSIIATIIGISGLLFSLMVFTLARISIVETIAEQSKSYSFDSVQYDPMLLFYLGSILVIVSLLNLDRVTINKGDVSVNP